MNRSTGTLPHRGESRYFCPSRSRWNSFSWKSTRFLTRRAPSAGGPSPPTALVADHAASGRGLGGVRLFPLQHRLHGRLEIPARDLAGFDVVVEPPHVGDLSVFAQYK